MLVAIPSLAADLQRLVDFAVRWYPYGGGHAEDIFVHFGLTEQQYFHRLAAIMSTHPAATGLDPTTIAAITSVCTARLTPPSARTAGARTQTRGDG